MDIFQYLPAVMGIQNSCHRIRLFLSGKVVKLWKEFRPKVVSKSSEILFELAEAVFNLCSVRIDLYDLLR